MLEVHHIVVNYCNNDISYHWNSDDSRNVGEVFECTDMPEGCEMPTPAAWAPGNLNYWSYPDFMGEEVVYPMGGHLFSHIVMQMHYNNAYGTPDVPDHSGFELYYKRDVPFYKEDGSLDYENMPRFPYTASFQIGSLGRIAIPPLQDWFEISLE
eukprot:UN26245